MTARTTSYDEKRIIRQINLLSNGLADIFHDEIIELLHYHEFEPSAASERIADLLEIPYNDIHKIVFDNY